VSLMDFLVESCVDAGLVYKSGDNWNQVATEAWKVAKELHSSQM